MVDEVQNVYLGSCKCDAEIVEELFTLGCLYGTAIHVIICGNSSELRSLAKGKLAIDKRG